MSDLIRFGISLNKDLLNKFDKLIRAKRYSNRSEAIRDLIRESLVKEEWEKDEDVVGILTIVFDHHKRMLTKEITEYQHKHLKSVLSSLHIHLDHDNCLEIIVIRDKSSKIKEFSDKMIALKGVKLGRLVTASTGEFLK